MFITNFQSFFKQVSVQYLSKVLENSFKLINSYIVNFYFIYTYRKLNTVKTISKISSPLKMSWRHFLLGRPYWCIQLHLKNFWQNLCKLRLSLLGETVKKLKLLNYLIKHCHFKILLQSYLFQSYFKNINCNNKNYSLLYKTLQSTINQYFKRRGLH